MALQCQCSGTAAVTRSHRDGVTRSVPVTVPQCHTCTLPHLHSEKSCTLPHSGCTCACHSATLPVAVNFNQCFNSPGPRLTGRLTVRTEAVKRRSLFIVQVSSSPRLPGASPVGHCHCDCHYWQCGSGGGGPGRGLCGCAQTRRGAPASRRVVATGKSNVSPSPTVPTAPPKGPVRQWAVRGLSRAQPGRCPHWVPVQQFRVPWQ
jgi:hypothetical protein